jgi:cyclopropane fatty-acyl-phospholipid synthase-like methyltransferase
VTAANAVGAHVQRHFEAQAERFDAIYEEEKGLPQKVVDRLFHQVIHRRFELALALCGDVSGKRVLDVGCGSGRYAVEFARRGADVVGIDFATPMLDVAREAAIRAGVEKTCRFETGNFLEWCEPHHFEICLGIGFFDYTADAARFLERMRSVTLERGIFSFPIRWTVRSLTRWMRLRLNRCPVFFYDERQIRDLAATRWATAEIHRLSRDFLVDARVVA